MTRAKDENIKELGTDTGILKTEAEISEFDIDIMAEDSISERTK